MKFSLVVSSGIPRHLIHILSLVIYFSEGKNLFDFRFFDIL